MTKKKWFLIAVVVWFAFFLFIAQYRKIPDNISYGISFSEFKSRELDLDPIQAFDAIVDDLGVREFRLSSHWPIVEPRNDEYDFSFLDYQIKRLEEVEGSVILTLGRRQPAWPECHIPEWAAEMNKAERNLELLSMIEVVVERYKDSPAIEYWQVENEPFLSAFAADECGPLDRDLLKREIDLVKTIDPTRDILVTDSGNIGTWVGAYRAGDLFGTSLYRYFWTPELGIFESRLPISFYRLKYNLIKMIYGKKPAFLIELAGEPWLTQKIVDTDIDTQISRMTLDMLKESIRFASKTGFDVQYLWGGEWWFYMTKHGHPEYWNYAKTLFK